MDARDTQKYYKKYSIPRGALYGAVGGLVAGWVMAPFLIITMILIGAPEDAFFTAFGGYFIIGSAGDDFQTGLTIHMASSIAFGVIFGATTAAVHSLRITSFAKGVGEGFAAGGIVFIAFFIPLLMAAVPGIVDVMVQQGQVTTEQQRSAIEADVFAALVLLGAFDHIAYGAVLGVVVSAFIVGVRKIPKMEKTDKGGKR